jgi:hypothetical protein
LKTGFVTDAFSTLGGLAAVAYGNPNYFREVKNQIFSTSSTRFVDAHSPSDVFLSMVPSFGKLTEKVVEGLEVEYQKDSEFTDYADVELGPTWRSKVKTSFPEEMARAIDSRSTYDENFSSYLESALARTIGNFSQIDQLASNVTAYLNSDLSVSRDLSLIAKVVTNNPLNKLSVPPKDSKVYLDNSVELGLDHRGVEFTKAYLTPSDYFSNVPIPGMVSPGLLPSSIRDSVVQGYEGYPKGFKLESLFNPVGATSIGDVANPDQAISSPDPFMAGSILGAFPEELQADRDIYSISLMGELLNGYTTFNPSDMSNGELLDESQTSGMPLGEGIPGFLKDFTKAYG